MMYILILKICVQSVYIGVTIDDKLSSDAQRRIEHERDNQQILREIVLNPTIHGKNLNRYLVCLVDRISHSKINLWLEQEGYPKLERTSQGNFIVSSEIMTLFKRDVSEQQMLNGNNVILA